MGHLTSPYVAAFSISTRTPQAIKNQKGAISSGSLTFILNLFSSLLPKSLYRCDNESVRLHLTLPSFRKTHHEATNTSDSIRITSHPCTLVSTNKAKIPNVSTATLSISSVFLFMQIYAWDIGPWRESRKYEWKGSLGWTSIQKPECLYFTHKIFGHSHLSIGSKVCTFFNTESVFNILP